MTNLVWSYSMLDTFETCPRKWHDKYILKNKEPESEAIRYGNFVHKSIEDYLGKDKPLPSELEANYPIINSVKQQFTPANGFAELKLGITKELQPCGFFDKDVWGRGAADVTIVSSGDMAFVGDWKTGKKREKEDQLKILSMFIFNKFPQLKTIKACNIWLKPNEMGEVYTFHKKDETEMWTQLLKRLSKMYNAVGTPNAETMTPGFLCGYCPVKACRFNKS